MAPRTLPEDLIPSLYDLHIYNFQPEKKTYDGDIVIHLEVKEPTDEVVFNAKDLELKDVHVFHNVNKSENEIPVKEIVDNELITIKLKEKVTSGTLLVNISFTGNIQSDKIGFYKGDTDVEGRVTYTTNLTTPNARLAFPCLDNILLKAPFKFGVTANPGQLVSSILDLSSEADVLNDNDDVIGTRYQYQVSEPIAPALLEWTIHI
ncbi:Putative aminopeptidase 2 [Komagataella phaffii CBS 7435]|uniref:Putative aminopeptidase 2 n=1 Tax=Komagataella phaffii (strain ATCC 76273 / CBS 7435 / CECT 11047 / NRRL Y-11430 / Wegner 21-1) TaxID=981350 RepID=F2QT62_KOMPC|nr:GQ67_00432T0 [Komagataella phaffii]AOA67026.1 GQ68_00957T0 [Komagataella phaffii GS115]KAI0462901.1 hypothetical protein LJB42_003705 [Komagataella kurtzmanii]CAH2448471.1 Putative aminopeptidase 2 [Komagataella phaffii CBS 7435]CCA38590.1 Putative aminopeptidase 2 [Komagataella phaffii CBS 7435]